MPTPFTHMAAAQRLLADPVLPESVRNRLALELPAFLLGSIAADATRLHAPGTREDTHFYRYDEAIDEQPWRRMLERHPVLLQPRDEAQRIFLAGYVAHLGMDEIWTREIMWPLMKGISDVNERRRRALAITLLMTRCDERDYVAIDESSVHALGLAQPRAWLPFLSDADLVTMRDLILCQLRERSQTLDILSRRWGLTPQDFRTTLDDPARFAAEVLSWIPERQLLQVERNMDLCMRARLRDWLKEQALQSSSTALTRN
ncbi:MAG: zinc dependent phospholipase C family protein [Anaerolineaceae bacterium]|nr:zinc dependent phospholipase C family protein [Anaerolineaceae bacterium]